MAYNAGIPKEKIAKITGHKCVEELEPYIQATHKFTNEVIDAIDRMDCERRMKISKAPEILRC